MWKARICAAKDDRAQWVDKGNKNVEHYKGKIVTAAHTGQTQNYSVNLVYVDLKQSIASLYSKSPKIYFDPNQPGAEESAEILELLVNTKWNELKMNRLIREVIKSTKLYGVCATKTYYYFNQSACEEEYNDSLKNDEVRTDRVPLKHLLKDAAASSWTKSPWIAHQIEAPVSDIVDRFKLKDTDAGLVTVTKSTHEMSGDYDASPDVKKDFEFGTYYEIEDRKNRMLGYYIEGIDRLVESKPLNVPYDSMYDFLEYNDIPDEPNTMSDYEFWKNQLIEIGIYRTILATHAKHGNAKYKWHGPAPSEDQRTQLTTSDDSSFVVLNAGQDFNPVQHAQIDQAVFAAEQAARGDIQLISKQAPRQSVGDKTATEVKAVEMAAQEVTSENLERLEEIIQSVCFKWAKLMQKNYTSTRVVSLTEITGAEFLGYKNSLGEKISGKSNKPYLSVSSSDFDKSIRVRIKSGSTLPDNDATRMQKLMSFAKFVSSVPGAAAAIDIEELIHEATNVFDVRNENIIVRKDNPMEESRLLNSGVFVAAKLSEDHDKHLMMHEQESNNNSENILHILMHKMFKSQREATLLYEQRKMAQAGAMNVNMPIAGQSFVGMNPQQQPAPQGNGQAMPPVGNVMPNPQQGGTST